MEQDLLVRAMVFGEVRITLVFIFLYSVLSIIVCLFVIIVIRLFRPILKKINTTGATSEEGSTCSSGRPEFLNGV